MRPTSKREETLPAETCGALGAGTIADERVAAAVGRPHGGGGDGFRNAVHRPPAGMWVFRYVVNRV